jgi:hypothetical protein
MDRIRNVLAMWLLCLSLSVHHMADDGKNNECFDHVVVVIYPCSTWKTTGKIRNVLATWLFIYLGTLAAHGRRWEGQGMFWPRGCCFYLPLQNMEDDGKKDHECPCSKCKAMGRKTNVLTTWFCCLFTLAAHGRRWENKECFGHVVVVFIYPYSTWKTIGRRIRKVLTTWLLFLFTLTENGRRWEKGPRMPLQQM